MAAISILAKSKVPVNWDDFSGAYSKLKLLDTEIFPIPKELGFMQDAVGVNVHRGFSNKQTAISQLKAAVDFLTNQDFKLVELYNGIEITSENIVSVATKQI